MNAKKLADALRALHHQCSYMGAPDSHEDMRNAQEALAEYDAQPSARIVVTLEGGFVQDVSCDVPALYVVVDYDSEGTDEEELCQVSQTERDGTLSGYADAIVHSGVADCSPEWVTTRFNEVEAYEREERHGN